MTDHERTAMRVACIQAAATLLAPEVSVRQKKGSSAGGEIIADTTNCARHARDLFLKLTGERWEIPAGAPLP
jgi:hypothetical protein